MHITCATMLCHRDGASWGEYVTKGESYVVTRDVGSNGDFHFQSRRGSTFMRPWAVKRAIEAGWLEIV